jgi:D-glycero-D-manno-heptose 1,7-bisphosphate phosphatase
MKKAIFWDRDGTLVELVHRGNQLTSAWNLSEIRYLPDAKETITKAHNFGYLNFIVTNQPHVHYGDITLEECLEINNAIKARLWVDESVMALVPGDEDYKPNAGMINKLIKIYDVDVSQSYMIGDRWKDVLAGYNAGLSTIYVGKDYDASYQENKHGTFELVEPNYKVEKLLDILEIIK